MSDQSDTEVPAKPFPVPTPTSQPFWSGLAEGRVMIQFCPDCRQHIFYPRSHCPGCLRPDPEWREVTGNGHIHSFTVAREPTAPQFADETPLVLAIIELDEGPRLTSTILGASPDGVVIGTRVQPIIDKRSDGVTLLRYRIAEG